MSETGTVDGEVAVVTGAGAHTERALGIGEATAKLFGEDGASVVVVDREREMAERTAERVDGEAVPVAVDVTDREAVADLADRVEERFGRLDVLVNNAGIRIDPGPVTETNDRFGDIVDVNLRGVANCCEALLPLMADTGGGAVVNVASANAEVGRPDWALYDATKAGILGLTRDMACDHAEDDIRVNAVSPGWTITDYHLQGADDPEAEIETATTPDEDGPAILRRSAHPREQATAIRFLASEAASFVTGTNLHVDGGLDAVGVSTSP